MNDDTPQRKSFTKNDGEAPKSAAKPPEPEDFVVRFVKAECEKIERARRFYDKQFRRMEKNMDFMYGLQWNDQTTLADEDGGFRYVANVTRHQIEQKVAQLYARDPKVKAHRRKRLDFKMWDGRMDSIRQAQMAGAIPDPQVQAASQMLLTDYAEGRRERDLIDAVGKALEILCHYCQDNQQPNFKEQMKDLVRRVCVCGVGYLVVDFERTQEGTISPLDLESTIKERMGRIKVIVDRWQNKELDNDSPEIQTLQNLVMGINASVETGEPQNVNERIAFTFPQATAIIPDPDCICLTGFLGAAWIAEEFTMEIDEVNSFYGTEIKAEGEIETYTRENEPELTSPRYPDTGKPEPKRVRLWKVWNKNTKTQYVLCKGYKDFVEPPRPIFPEINAIWPVFALTFNKTPVDPNSKGKASIFPPSDVDTLRSLQKEWNRSRECLRSHRAANEPMYGTANGTIPEGDIPKLENHTPNSVIQFQVPAGTDLQKVIVPIPKIPIDPVAYDTTPLTQDSYFAYGSEPSPIRPGANKGTATAATIHEQARVTLAASNVDDLDSFLSDVTRAVGEMCLREMSKETVVRICGKGAVWTDDFEQKEEFINLLYLDVVAASSGRPNKALELANWQVVAPILQAAGASPMFIVQETLKRTDETLEIDDVFPMGQPMPMNILPGPGQRPALPPSPEVAPTRQNQFPAQTNPQPAGA